MSFTAFADKKRSVQQEYDKTVVRLDVMQPLVEWADRLANLWSLQRNWYSNYKDSRGRKVSLDVNASSWFSSVTLNLWMGPNDSLALESMGRVFDKVVFNDYFEDDVPCHDAQDASYRNWEFRIRKGGPLDNGIDSNKLPKFHIRAHVSDSRECKVVGTGKFIEVTRIECGAT